MKRLINVRTLCFVTAAAGGAVLPAGGTWADTTFYVSPVGNDAWSGTLAAPNAQRTDGPLGTLSAARDAVRRLKAVRGSAAAITVLVRGGRYILAEPLVFSPEDSGTPQVPIVYAAYPGEKPVLSGGIAIHNWRRHDARLWVADVPWAKNRPEPLAQLFVGGVRRTRARVPHAGNYFYSRRLE